MNGSRKAGTGQTGHACADVPRTLEITASRAAIQVPNTLRIASLPQYLRGCATAHGERVRSLHDFVGTCTRCRTMKSYTVVHFRRRSNDLQQDDIRPAASESASQRYACHE
jgi:hypothetical protein